MYRSGLLIVLLCVISTALSILPPPAKLEAFTEEDGAIIQITPVEGAAGYLGVLDDEGPSSVESKEPQLYFGDLKPLTEYTVIVSAVEKDGTTGDPEFLVFVTGVGEITNFKVITISSSIMTLEWDPKNGVERYIIVADEDTSQPPVQLVNTSSTADVPSIPIVRTTGEGSATVSGLKPMTFYKIAIRGMKGTDLGPVAHVRARTDGEGLVVYNVWTDHLGVTLGASASIFKTLDRPRGPYSLKITFPCELERIEVWDAVVQNSSNPALGVYDLYQPDVWMQEKNEIGFNYFPIYNESNVDNCFFEPNEIEVEYGIEDVPSEFTEEFDVPFDVTEWNGGGILYVRIEKIFRGPNQAASADEAEVKAVKPDRSQMAIQLVRGGNCSEINFMVCWNFDRVYNASIDGAEDAYFFIQPGDQWYTNDVGIVFEYDEEKCPDRTDWDVYMLVGGDLVKTIHESYESQDFYDTCADETYRDGGGF